MQTELPAADAFPAAPASWYLFGATEMLRRGPVSKRMLGRQLVAFRTASGMVAVMDAHCAHLGADLGHGTVQGETIQCPFHHWCFGADGRCVAGPDPADPSPRLRTYPAVERHGYLFFFNGREPLFPLPFFAGETPEDFIAGKPFRYVSDCAWYMNAANGFDMQHFLCVHGRRLAAPCEVDCPHRFARRNRYQADIVGDSTADRFLRRWAGPNVAVSITSWGGPHMLMTADFPRAHSHFLIAMQPLDDGRTLCEGIVFVRRSRSALLRRLWQPLSLGVRRRLTYGFVADEARTLLSVRYNPVGLGRKDREMIEFFQWVAALPQDASRPA
jgi:phenylpropionate dioxygenase-like ring-hydroxylating dioxygenase large terminal subunit